MSTAERVPFQFLVAQELMELVGCHATTAIVSDGRVVPLQATVAAGREIGRRSPRLNPYVLQLLLVEALENIVLSVDR